MLEEYDTVSSFFDFFTNPVLLIVDRSFWKEAIQNDDVAELNQGPFLKNLPLFFYSLQHA